MALLPAYGGDFLANGSVLPTATWNFNAQELNNVGTLGVGAASPSDIFQVETTAGTAILVADATAITTIGGGIAGQIADFGDGSNALIYTRYSGARTFFGYDGASALVQGGTGKGVSLQVNSATAGSGTVALRAFSNANVSIGAANDAGGKLQVYQPAANGAMPVLLLDQADVSEEFISFVGESAADNTMSLVDAADLSIAGDIIGWARITVTDVASTGGIVDGTYFVPFYDTPT